MSEKEFGTGYQEFGKIPSKERFDLRKEVESIREYLHGDNVKKAEFGLQLGHILSKKLEYIYSQRPYPNDEDSRELNGIYALYNNVFRDSSYLPLKNGFLAEIAVALSISRSIKEPKFKAYNSTKEEDLYHKIDLWVDMPQYDEVIGTQVKCISGVNQPIFIDLESPQEMNAFINEFGHLIKDEWKFRKNNQEMLEYIKKFDNSRPFMVVLPSPESEFAVFNSRNGLPGSKLGETINNELRRRYAKKEVAA